MHGVHPALELQQFCFAAGWQSSRTAFKPMNLFMVYHFSVSLAYCALTTR